MPFLCFHFIIVCIFEYVVNVIVCHCLCSVLCFISIHNKYEILIKFLTLTALIAIREIKAIPAGIATCIVIEV